MEDRKKTFQEILEEAQKRQEKKKEEPKKKELDKEKERKKYFEALLKAMLD